MEDVPGVHFDLTTAGKTTKRKIIKRKSGQVRNVRAKREPEIVGRAQGILKRTPAPGDA